MKCERTTETTLEVNGEQVMKNELLHEAAKGIVQSDQNGAHVDLSRTLQDQVSFDLEPSTAHCAIIRARTTTSLSRDFQTGNPGALFIHQTTKCWLRVITARQKMLHKYMSKPRFKMKMWKRLRSPMLVNGIVASAQRSGWS